jgi:hypothetical protein
MATQTIPTEEAMEKRKKTFKRRVAKKRKSWTVERMLRETSGYRPWSTSS